jgi:mono/diheme cytochrome c family protein
MSAIPGSRPAALLALLLTLGAAHAASEADRKLGERIYRDGLNARGEPVRALVGLPPSPLTGEKAACGACHSLGTNDPHAARDAAPDLAWSAVTDQAAAKGARAPYGEAAFARAVSEGIAPDGGQLSAAMPRYSLSRSEIAALAAYLKAPPAAKKSG